MVDIFTDDFIKKLLERDSISRKLRKWPMMSEEELANIYLLTNVDKRTSLPIYPNIKNCFITSNHTFNSSKNRLFTNLVDFKSNFDSFGGIIEVLNKFQGKLIVCGGYIYRSLYYKQVDSDVDFFFVNVTESEAISILKDALKILIDYNIKYGNTHFDDGVSFSLKENTYIMRNKYVTTLLARNKKRVKYQFIHRIYDSIDQILGGFDLGPSMMAYDGKRLYATELGAWCAFGRVIIADTTRRSTSYEARIYKYYKLGCVIVLPGLPSDLLNVIQKLSHATIDLTKFGEKLKVLMQEFDIDLSALSMKQFNNLSMKYRVAGYSKRMFLANFTVTTRNFPAFSVKSYTRDNINNDDLLKLSDYDGTTNTQLRWSKLIINNATKLRCNNLDMVSSIEFIDVENKKKYIKCDSETAKQAYLDKIMTKHFDNPNVHYDKDIYLQCVKKFSEKCRDVSYLPNRDHMIRLFAEYANDIYYLIVGHYDFDTIQAKITEISKIMLERMKINSDIVVERGDLKGVKWITENPGRQWTASINPIIKHPSDWYGKEVYVSYRTGIYQQEPTLRLIRKRQSVWNLINKDIFNYILQKLTMDNCHYPKVR